MEGACLTQMVECVTHTKGNILDLLITNSPDKVINVDDGGRLGKSDHCIINIEIMANPRKISVTCKRHNWCKADIVELRQQLSGTNWRETLGVNTSIEEKWSKFKIVLSSAVEKNVPKSTCKPLTQPKWITREIIKLLGRKKRAWKTLKLYPTEENLKRR